MNCKATTKNGEQCKNKTSKNPKDDDNYCHVHQPIKHRRTKKKSSVYIPNTIGCGCGN